MIPEGKTQYGYVLNIFHRYYNVKGEGQGRFYSREFRGNVLIPNRAQFEAHASCIAAEALSVKDGDNRNFAGGDRG
ncbi:hypothetical protein Alches_12620 [Alicyclobacillus hesperidum subsp. aegles]|nr:hypothetical protein Alches_12620 [Alicyclobacillus hesperidum subsp. aegles]